VLPAHGVSLAEAFKVWLRVALLSFGGPAGQIAVMHRILIEERRWISEARFLHALNYCHLLPGPEAQQLAIYIGWLMHKTKGGLIAGVLFVVPGVIALMALSWIYVILGNVGLVAGLFFGLKAAVLAVVVEAVQRIRRRARKSGLAVVVAALAFVALFFFAVPFPLVVLAAAAIGFIADRLGYAVGAAAARAKHGGDLLGEAIPEHARPSLARAVGVVAVWLPLWLGPVALLFALAGLGMAETTPGPLIMVVQYVGFLAGYRTPGVMSPLLTASLAGLLVTWLTFTPCFLWVFLGAPYIEAPRGARALSAALSAVTAAVVGVILNLAVWFAIHVIFHDTVPWRAYGLSLSLPVLPSLNIFATLLAIAAAIALFRFKVGAIQTLLACSVAGMVLHLALGGVQQSQSLRRLCGLTAGLDIDPQPFKGELHDQDSIGVARDRRKHGHGCVAGGTGRNILGQGGLGARQIGDRDAGRSLSGGHAAHGSACHA
jgi:chromate transporter